MTDNTSSRTVVIDRRFLAPPALVFQAYSQPELLLRWFGPPGYPLTQCDVDFRVGGRFCFGMTGPDGVHGPRFGGTYLDIIPNEKIAYSNGFLVDGGDPAPEQQMQVTLQFVADGQATRMKMTTVFGSQAMHDEHTGLGFVQGTQAGLDQLATLLGARA